MRSLMLVAAAVLAFPITGPAALVSYNFSGTVTEVDDSIAPLANVGGITVGDAFTGSFQFETNDAGPDLNAGNPNIGVYSLAGSATSFMTLTIDGLTFVAGPGSVQVHNNVLSALSPVSDALFYAGGPLDVLPAGWSFSPPAGSNVGIAFIDPTGTAFASDALPTTFDPSDWFASELFLSFTNVTFPGGSDSNVDVTGAVNLTPAAVPEPSSLMLLGLIGCGMGVARRWKRTASI